MHRRVELESLARLVIVAAGLAGGTLAAGTLAGGLAAGTARAAEARRQVDIPADSLAAALLKFSQQTSQAVVAPSTLVEGRRARPVKGEYAPREALGRLIEGSGLAVAETADGALVLREAAEAPAPAASPRPAASPPVRPAVQPLSQLEEVVVTARRSTEGLQRAPLSVTALSALALEQRQITTLDRAAQMAPNIVIEKTPTGAGAGHVFIRGIGIYDSTIYTDAPVSVYVDGVIQPRPGTVMFDMLDLERIEVLRGPQGTLFGRNTAGGAVAVYTKRPTPGASAEQKIAYGSANELIARGILNTGVIAGSGVRAKVAVSHHQRDGYVRNLSPNSPNPGELNTNQVRADLDGRLGDNLSALYSFDYTHQRAQQPATQVTVATSDVIRYFSRSPAFGGDPFLISPSRLGALYVPGGAPSEGRSLGHALTLDYAVSEAVSLKSITSYRRFAKDDTLNSGGQGALRGPVLNAATGTVTIEDVTPYRLPHTADRQRQVSQELQLLGSTPSISYVIGGYFFREAGSSVNPNVTSFVLPGGDLAVNSVFTRAYEVTSKSFAGFGHASYRPEALDRRLEVAGGIRFTHDRKTMGDHPLLDGVPLPARQLRQSWNDVSGTASVSYEVVPDVSLYARFATAYKAGGFTPGTTDNGYDPERAKAVEAGFKSEWLNRTLRINGALFRTYYSDLQIQNQINGLPLISNAGRAVYSGGELEMTALLGDRLQFDGGIGYVDPVYKKYLYTDPLTGIRRDVSGEARFALVSRWTANVGAQYRLGEVAGGTVSARADFAYRSRKFFHPLDREAPTNVAIATDGQHNLSARLLWMDVPLNDRVTLQATAWVENLLNEKQRTGGFDAGALGFGANDFGRLRTFGVELTARF